MTAGRVAALEADVKSTVCARAISLKRSDENLTTHRNCGLRYPSPAVFWISRRARTKDDEMAGDNSKGGMKDGRFEIGELFMLDMGVIHLFEMRHPSCL